MKYYETSALENTGIDKMFQEIADCIGEKMIAKAREQRNKVDERSPTKSPKRQDRWKSLMETQ